MISSMGKPITNGDSIHITNTEKEFSSLEHKEKKKSALYYSIKENLPIFAKETKIVDYSTYNIQCGKFKQLLIYIFETWFIDMKNALNIYEYVGGFIILPKKYLIENNTTDIKNILSNYYDEKIIEIASNHSNFPLIYSKKCSIPKISITHLLFPRQLSSKKMTLNFVENKRNINPSPQRKTYDYHTNIPTEKDIKILFDLLKKQPHITTNNKISLQTNQDNDITYYFEPITEGETRKLTTINNIQNKKNFITTTKYNIDVFLGVIGNIGNINEYITNNSNKSIVLNVFEILSKQKEVTPKVECFSKINRSFIVTDWNSMIERVSFKKHKDPKLTTCFHELIKEGAPCKYYMDLDYEYTKNNSTNSIFVLNNNILNDILDITINETKKKICTIFNMLNTNSNDGIEINVIILDASTKLKYSKHLIFNIFDTFTQKHIYFANNYMCKNITKEIILNLKQHLLMNDNLFKYLKDIEYMDDNQKNIIINNLFSCIDTQVYEKNKTLRSIYSSKIGDNRFLIPQQTNNKEYNEMYSKVMDGYVYFSDLPFEMKMNFLHSVITNNKYDNLITNSFCTYLYTPNVILPNIYTSISNRSNNTCITKQQHNKYVTNFNVINKCVNEKMNTVQIEMSILESPIKNLLDILSKLPEKWTPALQHSKKIYLIYTRDPNCYNVKYSLKITTVNHMCLISNYEHNSNHTWLEINMINYTLYQFCHKDFCKTQGKYQLLNLISYIYNNDIQKQTIMKLISTIQFEIYQQINLLN